MATGASTAEAAVILMDARKGLLAQTKRHSHICHLFGIKHIIVAINKMDLVGYEESRFQEILSNYELFASTIGIEKPIPSYFWDSWGQYCINLQKYEMV